MQCHFTWNTISVGKKMEPWKIVKVCILWTVTSMCTIIMASVFCGANPMNKNLKLKLIPPLNNTQVPAQQCISHCYSGRLSHKAHLYWLFMCL
jgi:hypothetical protein